MSGPAFRVRRAVWVGGIAHQPGEVISVNDRVALGLMLRAGQLEPADDATAAKLRSKPSTEWPEYREPTGEYIGFRS